MKKSPKHTAQHAPRALRERDLQIIKGGDGAPANPGLDVGAIQQMMEASYQQGL